MGKMIKFDLEKLKETKEGNVIGETIYNGNKYLAVRIDGYCKWELRKGSKDGLQLAILSDGEIVKNTDEILSVVDNDEMYEIFSYLTYGKEKNKRKKYL